MPSELETIFAALSEAEVRYLVVGGVAVLLHGLQRFTADLDLAIDLEPDNARRVLQVLAGLGYRPRAPVPLEAFVDPEQRADWATHRGMVVFSLWSDQLPGTEVDLFVQSPFDFEEAYRRHARILVGEIPVLVLSATDLIDMKTKVGRPRDLEDARALRLLGGPNTKGHE